MLNTLVQGFLVLLTPNQQTVDSIIRNKDAVYDYVQENFAKQYNIIWLDQLGFNNTYALMMRERFADTLGISTISDLAKYARK